MIGFGRKDIKAPAAEIEVIENQGQSGNSTFELAPQENISTINPVIKSELDQGNIQPNETENNVAITENTDSFIQITDLVTTYQNEAKKQDLEEINRQEVEQQEGVKNGTIKMNDYKMKDEFKNDVLSLKTPSICN